jgi:hypothetical protein
MVAAEAPDSSIGMNPSSLTTSPNQERAAQSRWESESGLAAGLQVSVANNQNELLIPNLVSTEQAIRWGSRLNIEQHTTLVKTQRVLSKNALAERNMQRMVDLATQSQLLREAAEAFVPPERAPV